MKERDKSLLKSWMDGITLGDRKLRPIGAGQAVVLRALGNAFVTDGKDTSPDDMVEIVMVMTMTRDEISGYIEADDDQRKGILGRFAALHIDEIDGVIAQVAESLERLGNSVMESDNVGKEMRHAS